VRIVKHSPPDREHDFYGLEGVIWAEGFGMGWSQPVLVDSPPYFIESTEARWPGESPQSQKERKRVFWFHPSSLKEV
jgi:hypothetical protein